MAANLTEIRLRILSMVIPTASKVGIAEPENLIRIASVLEKYVVESHHAGEKLPDSPTRAQQDKPRKGKSISGAPAFLTPPHGG